MVLSDADIKKALKNKEIKITPFPNLKTQLGSCSLDLRLGNIFRVFEHSKHSLIDPFKKSSKETEFTREITVTPITDVNGETYILKVAVTVFWDEKATIFNFEKKYGSITTEDYLYNWY